jgi:hypothetical protein
MASHVHCDSCGCGCVPDKLTPGYGVSPEGKRYCFPCCGERDRASLVSDSRTVLYLDSDARCVTNWPGTLRIPVFDFRVGRHNVAGKRYDFRFSGPDGALWSGVQYGDNTQIAHCRKLRSA